MKKIEAIIFSALLISLTGCWNSSSWTEEERETFRTKCESQIYFDTDPICFTGFTYEEIDTVIVLEKDSITTIDTIYIYTRQERSKHDKENQKFWGSPDTEFNVNHSYEFYLESDTPYVLDNMEMIMWAQYTMAGEGWGCEMGNFTIDNEKFEHQGNIYFKKRGFKYDWE